MNNKVVNQYVWHGSSTPNIKVFEPRESTQIGKFVYATEKLEIAAAFGANLSSIQRTLQFENDKLVIVERIQDYFKNNDHPIYIYKFEADDFEYFEDNNWDKNEVRSQKSVKPIEEIAYPSYLELYKQLDKENKIKLYLYPDKPKSIPLDDSDIIQTCIRIHAMNPSKNFTIWRTLAHLYPKFGQISKYLKEHLIKKSAEEIKKYGMDFVKEHKINDIINKLSLDK